MATTEIDKVELEVPEEVNLSELPDDTDWKAKADELQKKHQEAGIRNREKTKAFKERIAELEKNQKPSKEKETKHDEDLLKRLDKVLLRSAQITHQEDVELFEKWKERTKMDSEAILGDDIFQEKLEKLRTTRANLEATANIKGEAGASGAKNTPEYWIGKATKGADGGLMFPDDMPKDRKLAEAIIDKLGANEKGQSKKVFYNE